MHESKCPQQDVIGTFIIHRFQKKFPNKIRRSTWVSHKEDLYGFHNSDEANMESRI